MLRQTVTPETVTKRILVADDNEDIRNVISLILRSANYEVCSVGSGAELLENFSEFAPDLIILDIMMPYMSGFEVLEKVRASQEPYAKSLPIIVITAKSMEADIERALKLGADSYIVKPFRANALLEVVLTQITQENKT